MPVEWEEQVRYRPQPLGCLEKSRFEKLRNYLMPKLTLLLKMYFSILNMLGLKMSVSKKISGPPPYPNGEKFWHHAYLEYQTKSRTLNYKIGKISFETDFFFLIYFRSCRY
jgi:hypothetical protein